MCVHGVTLVRVPSGINCAGCLLCSAYNDASVLEVHWCLHCVHVDKPAQNCTLLAAVVQLVIFPTLQHSDAPLFRVDASASNMLDV